MNTNKPLSEWTLAEVKAECEKHEFCKAECPAYRLEGDRLCRIRYSPTTWDLTELPCWTEQDKEDAHTIKAILLETSRVTIARLPSGAVKLSESGRCVFLDLNCNLFPSLKPGESATFDEIIGGGK